MSDIQHPEPPLNPGDQAPPGTGEQICRACKGSGLTDGKPCPECGGSGRVIEGVGGA